MVLEQIKGILKMFWKLTKEDWEQMDNKIVRIVSGIIGFIIAGLFWFYVIRHIIPF